MEILFRMKNLFAAPNAKVCVWKWFSFLPSHTTHTQSFIINHFYAAKVYRKANILRIGLPNSQWTGGQ